MKERVEEIKKRYAEIQDEKKRLDREAATLAKIYVDKHIDFFLDEIAADVERVNEGCPARAWLSKIPRRKRKWYRSKTRSLTRHERDYLADRLFKHFSDVTREDWQSMQGGRYHVTVKL